MSTQCLQKNLKIAPLLLLLFSFSCVYAQTTIWSEDFTYSNGTTSGPSGKWSTDCPGCLGGDYFEVRSNRLSANDVNSWATWESETITIPNCGDLEFTIEASETGDHDGPGCGCLGNIDYLDIYYRINGGSYTIIEDWMSDGETGHTLTGDSLLGTYSDSDWGSHTITITGLVATSLQLKVELRNTAGDEIMNLDNLEVTCNAPLSIEGLEFDGFVMKGIPTLFWEIDQHLNPLGFEIQRSLNGKTFGLADKIEYDGSRSYSYTDPFRFKGIAFYRMKVEKEDGGYEYSDVIELKNNGLEYALSEVYPNPANTSFSLDLASNEEEIISIRVYDLSGQMIWQDSREIFAGGNVMTIPSESFETGLYLVKIGNSSWTATRKVTIW